METTVITVEYSRIIRDITIISIIPQLGLIIAFFLRGVGVNFNKFGFEDDLKDLEISNEDNEEVEITFNNDGTKFKRTLRRFRREFKYYVKENKIIFIIGTIILIFVIGFISYKNFPTNFDKSYNEGEILSINGVSYTLENSMLTNIDYNGNIVDKDNYFLVIKLKIDNNNGNDYEFDYHNFKLELNNNSLYPELGYNRKFVDYVTTYKTNIIKGNSSGYFPLIYKISTDTLNSKYKIKISNGQVNTDSGKIYVNVNPIIIDEFSIEKTVNLDDELIFTNSNLNNTTLKLSNLIITNKYVYDYEFCLNNVCSTLKDQVSTGFNSLSTLLIFDYEYNIVEDVPFYSYSATFGGFIENFARIKYLKNNEMIYGSITNKTPDKLNNKIVLEVTNNAINSNEVYLSFLIRNKEYLIKIK